MLPELFTETPLPWLGNSQDEIVLSTEISLSRNLPKLPFPQKASSMQRLKAQQKIMNALGSLEDELFPQRFALSDLRDIDRDILSERRILANNFELNDNEQAYLYSSDDESLRVLINTEDHFKVTASQAGNQLDTLLASVEDMDSKMQQELTWSQSEKYGYLTACPLLIGSGCRALALLNLTALDLLEKSPKIINACSMMGWNLRSLTDSSENFPGNIYIISNQRTLGHQPKETVKKLNELITELRRQENAARRQLAYSSPEKLLDYIARPYGSLSFSHLAKPLESFHELMIIRTGTQLELLRNSSLIDVDQLITETMNAHLHGKNLLRHAEINIDQLRSDKIKALLRD